MSNIYAFSILVASFSIFIFSSIKISNERLSVFKYISLIVLPSTLVGIFGYVISLYSYFFEVEYDKFFPSLYIIILPTIYGLILMLPSLMLYAVYTLSLEKRFSPPAWKLFLWTGLIAGLSALPYDLMMGKWIFSWIAIVTGTLSMIIVYFVSRWRNKKIRRK